MILTLTLTSRDIKTWVQANSIFFVIHRIGATSTGGKVDVENWGMSAITLRRRLFFNKFFTTATGMITQAATDSLAIDTHYPKFFPKFQGIEGKYPLMN